MSVNDYVKFMTQEIVQYMDKPKDDRKKQRQQKKQERQPFAVRWFGVLPYALIMMKSRQKNK